MRNVCAGVEPTSGLYLDDIDLTKREVGQYVEGVTVQDLVEAKINFSTQLVAQEINNKFLPTIRTRSQISDGRLGYFAENMQVNAAVANTYKGVNMRFCNEQSHLDLYISKLSIFTDFTGIIDVEVWDMLQNKLIDTITVAGIANEVVTVSVNKKYTTNNKRLDLAFVYNSTGINSYRSDLLASGCSSCNEKNGWYSVNYYFDGRGVTIPVASPKIGNNLSTTSDTGGLAVQYSINCNYSEWLCQMGNLVAMPILFKTAAEIMSYAERTKRFNDRAQNDKEHIKERKDYYELKYRELMDNVTQNIQPPKDMLCFTCNDRIKTVITLP
jgi:hypothetical protein